METGGFAGPGGGTLACGAGVFWSAGLACGALAWLEDAVWEEPIGGAGAVTTGEDGGRGACAAGGFCARPEGPADGPIEELVGELAEGLVGEFAVEAGDVAFGALS